MEDQLWRTNYKRWKSEFWQRIIGFEPEDKYQENANSGRCKKCLSRNVENKEASPWTSKLKCDDCGYFTYIVWTDRMGGGLHDEIAVDKRDATI